MITLPISDDDSDDDDDDHDDDDWLMIMIDWLLRNIDDDHNVDNDITKI